MKNTLMSLLVCSIFLFSFTFVFPVETCSAEELHVGSEYTYIDIQSALNAANNSDTIIVHSGTYNENIEIDKSITITGESKTETIISGNSNNHVIEITADYVNISGLTIQDTTGSGYDCIMVDKADNCRIENNILQNSNDAGISLFDSHSNTITENTITDNEEYGVAIHYSDSNIISNNQIYYNEKGLEIGSFSDNNEIYNNEVVGKHGLLLGTGLNIRSDANGNLVYKNKFSNFNQNAKDQGTGNTWYKSTSQEGNYWDDYTGEEGAGGYGTTPYDIPGDSSSQDIYPLGYFANSIVPTAEIVLISPNPVSAGSTVYFEGHTADDGSIVEWEWMIGSTVIGHGEDFSYSGLSKGSYTVSFRAKDNDGEWSSWDVYEGTLSVIEIGGGDENQRPTATIETIFPSTAKYGEKVYFHGSTTDDGEIVFYYWSSNIDGYIQGGSSFYKADLSVGTHEIIFKVRDNENKWSLEDTAYVTVELNQSTENILPVASTNGPYTAYMNETVNFSGASSYDPDGGITLYQWTFGDGSSGYGVATNHTYSKVGTYAITLTIIDNKGGSSTSTTTANIRIKPITNGDDDENGGWTIPGFEIILLLAVVLIIALVIKFKK